MGLATNDPCLEVLAALSRSATPVPELDVFGAPTERCWIGRLRDPAARIPRPRAEALRVEPRAG
jgi:hypothetical protein